LSGRLFDPAAKERSLGKLCGWLAAALLGIAGPVSGQPEAGAAATVSKSADTAPQRTFLPGNWLRGYVDVEFAPPTNEPDC